MPMSEGVGGKRSLKATARRKLVVLLIVVTAMAPLFVAAYDSSRVQNGLGPAPLTGLPSVREPVLQRAASSIAQTVTSKSELADAIFDDSAFIPAIPESYSMGAPAEYGSSGAAEPLSNGVSVTGILNGTGDSQMWYINCSNGLRYMRATLSTQFGNSFSLYGKLNSPPTTSSYDWSRTSSYSLVEDYYTFQAGAWYVMAYSAGGKGNYLLTVTVLYSVTQQPLSSGIPAPGTLNATADTSIWYIDVLASAASMNAVLTCPVNADFDLYARLGSPPTIGSFYWLSTSSGGENITYNTPSQGRWYIMPYSYFGNGSYQLTVTVTYPPPPPPSPPSPQPLTSGSTVLGYLNQTGDHQTWYISVPGGTVSLHSVLTNPNGSTFYLYGALSYIPSPSHYDWSATDTGSQDIINDHPGAGTWYIMVYDSIGNGTYDLKVTVTIPSINFLLASGVYSMWALEGPGNSDIWYVYVPQGTTRMSIVLTSVNNAVFDVYGLYRYYPTKTNYNWVAYGPYPSEVFYYPAPGYWYIMVYDTSGSGLYDLTVTVYFDSNDGGGGGGTQTSEIPILSVIGTGVVLFMCAVVVASSRSTASRRRQDQSDQGTESTYRSTEVPTYQPATQEVRRKPPPPVQYVQCRRCGASLKSDDRYCWNCGAVVGTGSNSTAIPSRQRRGRTPSGICMVCKRGLRKDDDMLLCPQCGGIAHRAELLEWLHVKGSCPACGQRLDEKQLHRPAEV
jgi:hypothetical protein